MLKYYNHMVVFEEIPNEITLAINITNCPCHCKGCHSKFLWEDVGTELSYAELDSMIERNFGITCVCFMGGDIEPSYVMDLCSHIRDRHPKMKIGWYSGKDELYDGINLNLLDYVKIGRYDEACGGLDKETTNQKMFKVIQGELEDITHIFYDRTKNRTV